jgi:hypothetical protein
MTKLFFRHAVSEQTARRFSWSAGFLLLGAITALVLKMLPELGLWASMGLVSAVALAWVVLGAQFPRMIVRA